MGQQGGERPMGSAAYGGKGFKGRAAASGDRPMGAARCRQQHNQASCQPAPPPSRGCRNEKKKNSERPIRPTMAAGG